MADDFVANAGAGGDTFAADDILGVKYPRSKLVIGADGVNDGDVSSANPLPVTGVVAVTDNAGSLTIDDGGSSLTVDGTVDISGSVAVTGPLTNTQLRASAVPVSLATLPTLANVTTVATVTNITNQGQLVDNAAFTDATTRLTMAGYIFDEVAGTALTENDGAAARVDSKRAQVMVVEDATTRGQRQAVDASGNAAVAPKPTTAGGLSIGKLISANSTNATSLKGSAGQVYTIYAHNVNAAVRYLKIYNKASSPTVGTDTPVITFPIPGNTAGNGAVLDTGGMGIAFATGIAYAVTTGVADSDTAAVAANEIVLTILYK